MSKETAAQSGRGMRSTDPDSEREGEMPSSSLLSPPPGTRPGEVAKSGGNGVASSGSSAPASISMAVPANGSSTATRPGLSSPDGDLPLLGGTGLPVNPSSPTTGEYLLMSRSRRRSWIRLCIFALLVALIANMALLGPLTDPAVGLTPRVPDLVPLSEVQPYGVNTFLHKEVESWKKDQTLSMAKDLGVSWIKQQFPWAEIEYRADPNNPFWDVKNNQSAWAKFDNIVSLAQQYNLRIIARIDSAPLWSHPGNPNPKAPPDAAHMADFGNFIGAFVTRYRGTVAAIQVWNEPNLKAEWGDKTVNAPEYAALLKTAYDASKQADPDMIVLAAPLATTNEQISYAGNLRELDYLQQMYDAGARQYFDAMAANAYGTQYPPEDAPSPDKLNFRRVELLHDVMAKNGDENKSVWFNEYGWNASPNTITNVPWQRVTQEQQADYTVRGIDYARQHWPWAGVFTIWYLRQVGDTPPTSSEYYFAMISPDFVAQPIYRAVQNAATSQDKIATPGQWGPLSSAVQAPSQWEIRLDSSVPGGMYVMPASLGSTLDVTFLGNDAKVMLVPPKTANSDQVVSARYYLTVDGSSSKVAQELPRDVNGQTYIDLPAGNKATEVVVARGLNPEMRTGQHLLEIKTLANPSGVQPPAGGHTFSPAVQRPDLPGIGVITVEAHRSYILFGILTLILLSALAVALMALRRSRPSLETSATGR